MAEHVLVIKLGALGDFVLAFGPFAAIRAHHPGARITLLTTLPYASLAAQAPWFDRIEIDTRPKLWQFAGLARLRRQLRGCDITYDLQTSGRSTAYFWLAGRPPWSGIGIARRYPDRDPHRNTLHTRERQRGQLQAAGLQDFPPADLAWLTQRPAPLVPTPYALLIPGAAAHRPDKRWPAANFAQLARTLADRGIMPVLVGGPAERSVAADIRAGFDKVVDLVGRTDLTELAALAAHATVAIGNDTGPMHLAAAVGCRCIVLFGGASDPTLTSPRALDGSWSTILRASDLADLTVAAVTEAV